jgi:hypothetical protein
MPNDTYTKSILTVIALCLVWLCAMTTGWPVQAQQKSTSATADRPQPVVIVGWGTVDADGRVTLAMSNERGQRITDPNIPVKVMTMPPGALDVRLEYSDGRPLPVGITRIDPVGAWEPIRSAVEGEPARSRPGR